MSDKPRMLVVDDEAAICQACRRVFARQGFEVEQSTDAREGLGLAMERDYAGILLDIKMPEMDGVQFLEELRKKKPDVPVMIMTGYPSIPNAAAAVRLGASEYITKPFTPEDITQAVQRMLRREAKKKELTGSAPETVEPAASGEPAVAAEVEFFFLDEAWLRCEEDGSACVGAVLPSRAGNVVETVQLPRIGEVVYQGLALAGVTMAGKSPVVVPSPLSGVVIGVNELLGAEPSTLLRDPCGTGWIACICTTRLDEEVSKCKPRGVLLAGADESSAEDQRRRLTSLGCLVEVLKDREELDLAVQAPRYTVLVIDADSFAEDGPEIVRRVNAAAPSMKVVVVASSGSPWEAAYRQRRIFYYAVEPFADNEILEIFDAALKTAEHVSILCQPARHLQCADLACPWAGRQADG